MSRTLAVLMWKHLMVRLRRFIHTPIEIISPTILFILLFAFKNDLLPVPLHGGNQKQYVNVQNTDPMRVTDYEAPKRILYYPETRTTTSLMENVGKKLGLEFKPADGASCCYPITNMSAIEALAKTMSDNSDAIVMFKDVADSELPTQLTYTIRMKNEFATERYKSLDESLGPHLSFGTRYQSFMRLQWAIDSSYITMKSNKTVDQVITMQEFPFNATGLNSSIKQFICSGLTPLCWLSLAITFVFLMARLLEERSSGIQELIKMVGVSPNTLAVSHYLNVLPAGLAYSLVGTVLLTVTSNPFLPHTNGVFIFLALALHFMTVVTLASVCSYVVKNTQYTATLAIFAHVILWIPTRLLIDNKVPRILVPLTGLLPHMPLQWFWDEVGALEMYGKSLTLNEIMRSHSGSGGTVFFAYLCLLIQVALFYLLSWYLSLVRPGQYGQALPWSFICQSQYWNPKRVTPEKIDEEEDLTSAVQSQYFEHAPSHLAVGIKIDNVSKMFPKRRALNDVSLNVYKGEITVLLGHNGAGKTTLMNIITGMYSATEGKVYVNGYDSATQQNKIRKHVGLCPQHNLSFPDLTVLEHVMFFTLLKGGTYNDVKARSLNIIKRLGLNEKVDSKSADLSGGMKRRLQLGCALAGEADVLILDEPTAGLDVETRRELWNLLLGLRGDRTLLLSTHFMEEADALGDRVAALHAGVLRCHATPMYLKRAIGTGYRLSFTTLGAPMETDITDAVKKHVSEAMVKEKGMNSMSYSLPAASSEAFPKLFRELEDNRSSLGIDTIGVGRSTLEEVFLKLCSDVDTTFTEDEVDGMAESTFNKVTGIQLIWRQIIVLFKRQLKYVMSRKIAFLFLQIILPIVCICSLTHGVNDSQMSYTHTVKPKRAMDLSMYDEMDTPRALYNLGSPGYSLRSVVDNNPRWEFQAVPDVAEAALRSSSRDIFEYSTYILGVEVNDTSAKGLYTTIHLHAAPISLNLLSNILASQYIGESNSSIITTYNHPLDLDNLYMEKPDIIKPKSDIFLQIFARFIVFLALAVLANAVTLPCKERSTQTRHIHIMTGCPPELYWLTTLAFHALLYTVVLLIPILIAAVALEQDHTINQPHFLGTLFLTLLVGILAFLAFMYCLSMFLSERVANVAIVAIIVVFSLITPILEFADDWTKKIANISQVLVPAHTLTLAVLGTTSTASINAYCNLNYDKCPSIPDTLLKGFSKKQCCDNPKGEPFGYFSTGSSETGAQLLILMVQFIVYLTLTFLTERGLFNLLYDRLYNISYRPVQERSNDQEVRAEGAYVGKGVDMPTKQIPDAMLASDLHKSYRNIFGKSCNAVKGISFSVKKGECFGLLGVNGAGKSTTFKMLTAEECPTKGRIFANGHHLTLDSQRYLNTLGYCPQFFGLDTFQTGRENLTLLLTLRGLNVEDVKNEVEAWIQVVGLEKYIDRLVSDYSGGCARRLACAGAVSCGAPLSLLDEPTAGVDPAARRRVWRALRRSLAANRAVLITSHSMDEMEALCSRIAIMAGGRIVALGSPAALRANHAAGHAVLLKLNNTPTLQHPEDVTDGPKKELNRLKADLHQKFDCTLKDEHKSMLHIHINETIGYSDLFTRLEHLKAAYPHLIEDYSVTETTLEEVFLSFAKEVPQGATNPVAV